MKTILIIVTLLCSTLGLANSRFFVESNAESNIESSSVIYDHRIEPCTSWTYARTDNGSGYLCSYRGMSIRVPDSQSVVDVISRLENRIKVLETKLEALEQR